MARLVLLLEGKDKKEIEINSLVSIGRAFDNILCIQDKKVSRYQAIIEKQGDGYYLSDLGSINGTMIGSEKIASNRKLKDGEVIMVGGVGRIEFHADHPQSGQLDAPSPAATAQPDAQAANQSLETTLPESKQPAAPAPPARRSPGLMLLFIAVPVLLIASVGALIFANSDPKNANGPGPNGQGQNGQLGNGQLANQRVDPIAGRDGAGSDEGNNANPTSNSNSTTTTIISTNTTADATSSVSLGEIQTMCQQLATKISGKSDYTFDREFLMLVDRLTHDYLDVRVDERACRNIGVYCNDKNIPVTLGLTLAMQRSKFNENKNPVNGEDSSVGLLRLPQAIAKGYAANEEELSKPGRATEIGIDYLKDVVDKFLFGKDDFAFAVACYGANISQVGDITTRLNEGFADARARQNFWKIINSRQLPVPAKASENVARFFAAGIVGENPKRFNLSRNPLNPF